VSGFLTVWPSNDPPEDAHGREAVSMSAVRVCRSASRHGDTARPHPRVGGAGTRRAARTESRVDRQRARGPPGTAGVRRPGGGRRSAVVAAAQRLVRVRVAATLVVDDVRRLPVVDVVVVGVAGRLQRREQWQRRGDGPRSRGPGHVPRLVDYQRRQLRVLPGRAALPVVLVVSSVRHFGHLRRPAALLPLEHRDIFRHRGDGRGGLLGGPERRRVVVVSGRGRRNAGPPEVHRHIADCHRPRSVHPSRVATPRPVVDSRGRATPVVWIPGCHQGQNAWNLQISAKLPQKVIFQEETDRNWLTQVLPGKLAVQIWLSDDQNSRF